MRVKIEFPKDKEPEAPATPPRKLGLFGPMHEEIEKGKPRWTYLIAPLLTLLGTIVTVGGLGGTLLFTALSYKETVEKNRVDRNNDNLHNLQTRNSEAQSRLETRYSEVQGRLANATSLTRAAAVIQLADIAKQYLPPQSQKDLDSGDMINFSPDHYPFFMRTIQQLATILTVEEDNYVRERTKYAIYEMVSFLSLNLSQAKHARAMQSEEYSNGVVKVNEADVALAKLTEVLADANLTAKDNFSRNLAKLTIANYPNIKAEKYNELNYLYDAAAKSESTASAFTGSVLFAPAQEAAIAGLKSIVDDDKDERRSFFVYLDNERNEYIEKLPETPKPNFKKNEDNKLPIFHSKQIEARRELIKRANQLIDTRDALGIALTGRRTWGAAYSEQSPNNYSDSLPAPAGYQLAISGSQSSKRIDRKPSSSWTRTPQIHLSHCFLVGADLRGAKLQGIDLSEAQLQGSDLEDADMTEATLTKADLEFTKLNGASLRSEDISSVYLYGAILTNRGKFTGDNWADANYSPKLFLVFKQKNGSIFGTPVIKHSDSYDQATVRLKKILNVKN